jgi:hypothetical protein
MLCDVCTVKASTFVPAGIHVELARMVTDQWNTLSGILTGRHVGQATLDRLLEVWSGPAADRSFKSGSAWEGGAGDADEGAGGKGGVGAAPPSKYLNVLGESLTEDELRGLLMEMVMEGVVPGGEAAAGLKGGSFDTPAPATPDEVAAVAKYIIKRFGTSRRPVADVAEDDPSVAAGAGAGGVGGPGGGLGGLGAAGKALEAERDRLAAALERLAGVQRELAEAQRNLMAGQKQLAEQQARLVGLMAPGGAAANR